MLGSGNNIYTFGIYITIHRPTFSREQVPVLSKDIKGKIIHLSYANIHKHLTRGAACLIV